MGIATKEEAAIIAAGEPWRKLPPVVARAQQIAAILAFEGAAFNADGLTRALQIDIALDQQNPLERVVPWMQRTKQWPFDTENGEMRKGQP